ncbi:MAG: methyltransferase domain-containing protein [Candidatus Omnitrophota bacterium]
MPSGRKRAIPAVHDCDQQRYWERHAHGRKWDHPVVAAFVQQRLAYVERFIRWSELQSVLDVGCGYGNTLYFLREKCSFCVGVDGSFAMLSGCPQKTAFLLQAHASRLPFADGSFDCLMGWEILHHLENPLQAVSEFARVSRRYVILFEPNWYHPAQFLLGLLDRSERGSWRFSQKRLEALSRAAGLTVLHAATVGSIFPNRMPTFLLPLAKRFPFRLPGTGISSLVIALKRVGT